MLQKESKFILKAEYVLRVPRLLIFTINAVHIIIHMFPFLLLLFLSVVTPYLMFENEQ